MALVLRRNLGPIRALVAGEYTIETASGRPALCCPDCGEIHELDEQDVPKTPDGRLPYVRVCPTQSCAFKDFVRLEAFGEDVAR